MSTKLLVLIYVPSNKVLLLSSTLMSHASSSAVHVTVHSESTGIGTQLPLSSKISSWKQLQNQIHFMLL